MDVGAQILDWVVLFHPGGGFGNFSMEYFVKYSGKEP